MERNRQIAAGITGIIGVFAVVLMTGCGKEETGYGTAGTALGSALGASLAGKNSKFEGACVGGIVGNCLGRSLGRSIDRKEEKKKHKKEVNELRAENSNLRHQLTKWCVNCNRQVRMRSAKSCPDCGGGLIQEKFCDRCKTIFSPECGYRYCPYCSDRVALKGR